MTNILTTFEKTFGDIFATSAEQTATGPNMPRRRGKAAKTIKLEDAIVRIVDERHPVTVRGVCYALFAEGLIAAMEKSETQRISRVMTEMRETGALDWRLIVDGSRAVERIAQWSDPSAIVRQAVRQYRRDNWQDQPARVEVWSEKATVQGILAPVLDEYGVTFRVMKGFGSFTAVRQVAEDTGGATDDQARIGLYIGDWDPSGLYMSAIDLPARLARYGSTWTFERIALVAGDLPGLPHFGTSSKTDDSRTPWYIKNTTADPAKCWELDAMDPNDLRRRVEDEIVARMDIEAWERALAVEATEVESMKSFQAAWITAKGVKP